MIQNNFIVEIYQIMICLQDWDNTAIYLKTTTTNNYNNNTNNNWKKWMKKFVKICLIFS